MGMIRTMMTMGALWALVATGFVQMNRTELVPKWRAGDKRHVAVERETTLRIDTATTVTKEVQAFDLMVNRANKNGYELWVRSSRARLPRLQLDFGTADPARLRELDGMLESLVAAMYQPLQQWDVRYEIDTEGGVLGRLPGKEDKARMTNAMRESLARGFDDLPGGRVPLEFPTEIMADVVDSLYEDFLTVQRIGMDRLLGVYEVQWPTSGSRREARTLEGVELPFVQARASVPGMHEVGVDRDSDKEMTCRLVTTFDPDAVHDLLKGAGGVPDLQREGLLMKEESVLHIEKRTAWVTAIHTTRRLRSGAMQVDTTERVRVTAVR